jgi:pyrroloquinoline quinone (PQQ) biosynthesis protein C
VEIEMDGAATISSEEAYDRIVALARGCSEHPALKNAFYQLWMARALPVEQVELVARNFYERVRRTPERIALAFLHMDDAKVRAETVENLSDEMGRGNPARVHSVILRGFFETLLSRLHGRPVDFDEVTAPILPSTVRLIEGGEKVFSSSYPQEACGALLAQEWHAYPQLVYLYEGARNYRGYFGLEEFHESCEYFYLHIGATEKQHKVHSLSTAARMCRSEADLVHLERGFETYLGLLADNWAEIHAAIESSAA